MEAAIDASADLLRYEALLPRDGSVQAFETAPLLVAVASGFFAFTATAGRDDRVAYAVFAACCSFLLVRIVTFFVRRR